MSDPTPTPGTPAAPAPEATPQQESFSREYVEQLRGEAAKYRNEKKSAVDEAKAALTQEWEGKLTAADSKYAELEGKFSAREIELAKLRAAIALEVPTDKLVDFSDLIKGSTEEEITASAKAVLDLVGGFASAKVPATDPTQGKGGKPLPLNGDPLLAALTRVVRA